MKFALSFLLTILLFGTTANYAATQASYKELTISDIQSLIAALENPEKRQNLVNQLKLLVEAAKEGKLPAQIIGTEKKRDIAPIIDKGSANILKLTQSIAETILALPVKAASLAKNVPAKFSNVQAYFHKKENLLFLADLIIKLVITFAAGLILLWLLRKFLFRYKASIEVKGPGPAPIRKIALALFNIGIETAPYIALLVIGILFSSLLGLPRTTSAAIYAVLLIVLIWKILSQLANALIAPGDRAERLLPISDDLSAHIHKWSMRFIHYGAFAYIPIVLAEIAGAPASLTVRLKAIYLFVFVVMASAISFQWKDKISAKLKISAPGAEGKFKSLAIKAWNELVSKLYIFFTLYLVALFLISTLGYSRITKKIVIATIENIVVLLAASALWLFVSYLFRKLEFLKARAEEKYPGLESKVKDHLAVVHFIVASLILFFTISFISHIWGLNIYRYISSGLSGAILKRVISIGTVILLAYIAMSVVQFFVQRAVLMKTRGKMDDLGKKGKTVIPLIDKTVRYIILSISGLIILQQLGINIAPILAGAGIAGLAVGFGAQTLVKDIITGFSILIEDSISVGDVVVVKGTGGLVEAVNLRTVRMRDLAGNVHFIPNSSIDMVTNMTKDYSYSVIEVGVAYKEKVDEVMEMLKNIGAELQNDPDFASDIIEPLEIFGVDNFADSAVIIKIRIKTKPIKQWAVGRELRRRIKNSFDAKGIEIPFPHQTIYFGEQKELLAGPISVKIENIEQLLARNAQDPDKKVSEKEGPAS